jgi:hypothetical protein
MDWCNSKHFSVLWQPVMSLTISFPGDSAILLYLQSPPCQAKSIWYQKVFSGTIAPEVAARIPSHAVQNYCCLRFAGDPCHPLKIYFTTDYISNIDEVIHHFDLPLKDILLTASKIITKNNDEDFNLNILDSKDLSFLNTPNQKHITLISESLTSFGSIVKATTIQLWHTNLQRNRETEASQKLTAKLTSERVLSATVATAKAISNAVNNIEESMQKTKPHNFGYST